MSVKLRLLAANDRPRLEAVLRSDASFRDDEIAVALELIDDALTDPVSDYWFRVAELPEPTEPISRALAGYICFGPTPMTEASFDLYWIVVHAQARGRGVAARLIDAMEADLRGRGGRGVRIETSELDSYGAARTVYERHGYRQVGAIPHFYREGDGLLTFHKQL